MKKMTKFKVGDKVVPTESGCGHTGKVGTIVKRMCFYDWFVAFENNAGESFDEEDLEHFEEEETMTKFKVGDKVVPTKSTFGVTGRVGTIEKRGDMYDWLVVFENKSREPFDEEDLVHFEEEKEMTKKNKFFIGQSVIIEGGEEGIFLYDDGDSFQSAVVLIDGDRQYCDYEDLEPSDKFTFAQVVQGLLEGYFEDGTEFKVNGSSVFASRPYFGGLGLVKEKHDSRVQMTIGASLINATWTLVVPEEPIKELTLDELEEILGHKVKIKNND